MHGALRTKDVAQGPKTEIGIGQVVEHAGRDDAVERASELADVLDRDLMELEILQVVFPLELARMAQARLADVDARDACIGIAQRVPGRLRRSAAGHENLLLTPEGLQRPRQVEERAATIRVAVQVPVLIQAGERGRIRHPFVEVADLHLLLTPSAAARDGGVAIEQRVAHRARLTGAFVKSYRNSP